MVGLRTQIPLLISNFFKDKEKTRKDSLKNR